VPILSFGALSFAAKANVAIRAPLKGPLFTGVIVGEK
jgi:hypothetical protein